MLLIARKLKELSFGKLMEVYAEGNQENGRESWPDEHPSRQQMLAEQDFYDYLRQVFFTTPRAVYAIWQLDDTYVSALRLEPYRDGLLLEALETIPEHRRKGYGKALVNAVLENWPEVRIYSHVAKWNEASLQTHESCGFQKILDHAVYVDGSVHHNAVTLCREPR